MRSIHGKYHLSLLGVVFLTFAWFALNPEGKSSVQNAETLTFYQLDFDLDGAIRDDSDWGSVDLTHIGFSDVMYFNLAINGTWQVQNMAVFSREGEGVQQTVSFNFDLGVEPGTDVSVLQYAYQLTPYVLFQMPGGFTSASVADRAYALDSGSREHLMDLTSAVPLVGSLLVEAADTHKGFPNQDCGKNECVPAAVSNSLQFLNTKYELGIDPQELTIAKMKAATAWQAKGCDPNNWFKLKKAYMKARGFPIETKWFNNNQIDKASEAIRDGCDVEVDVVTHVAAIVGIAKQNNGNYQIEVVQDTEQGMAGGTKSEKVTFDPKSRELTGGWGLNRKDVKYFVVECPTKKPKPKPSPSPGPTPGPSPHPSPRPSPGP